MGPSYVPQTHMAIWVHLMYIRPIWLYGSILCTSDPYGYMGPSYVHQTHMATLRTLLKTSTKFSVFLTYHYWLVLYLAISILKLMYYNANPSLF